MLWKNFHTQYDYELVNTIANRIIEFTDDGKIIDKKVNYDEYLNQYENSK